MESNQQNSGLTPEQELALEQAKLQRVTAENQLLNKQAELQASKERERKQREDNLLGEALKSGPKFHPDRQMMFKLLRDEEYQVEFGDDGNVTALAGSKRLPIGEFLDFLAEEKPYLV